MDGVTGATFALAGVLDDRLPEPMAEPDSIRTRLDGAHLRLLDDQARGAGCQV
jgi:hypothetical protein